MTEENNKSSCPISGNCPTRITKHTFISSCLYLQEVLRDKKNSKKKKEAAPVCNCCPLREDIESGLTDFPPPQDIAFIDLTKFNQRVELDHGD